MEDYRSLSHTKWQYKYHIVFIAKYRKRRLYGVVRKHLGEVFPRLAKQKYIAEQEMEDRRLDQLEMPGITPE